MSFIRSVSDTMIIPQISCLTQQAIVWHALYLLMKPNQISSQSITLHASVLTSFCPYALISQSQLTVGIKITAAMWKVTGEFDSCGLWPIQAPLPSKSGPCTEQSWSALDSLSLQIWTATSSSTNVMRLWRFCGDTGWWVIEVGCCNPYICKNHLIWLSSHVSCWFTMLKSWFWPIPS